MCEFCSNTYHLGEAKWGEGEFGTPGGTVTWSFATTPGTGFGFSSYITDPAYRQAIREAFQAWEDVADIDFVEIAAGSQTDIHLGWDVIDGAYNVVGEASSSGSRTTATLYSFTQAEIRFDVAENWTADHDVARNEVGLYQVALHEIGHILGLNHTDDPDTIMYASDISGLPGLTASDIAGAQAFYGAAQGGTSPAPDPDPDPQPDPDPDPAPQPDPQDPGPTTVYAATRGNDVFAARAGDDVIDGMGGIDTLSLSGDQTDYTLMLSAGSIILTDRAGRDGTDTLISVERLDFQPGASSLGGNIFDIDSFDGITRLGPDDFAQIVELYIAYFNRAPDAVGLAFWGNAVADGLSMEEMAALFIDQDETRATYPAWMSDADFATAVYNNVLGRIPDAEGFDFWVGLLQSGDVGRDTFILSVLDGARAAFPAGATPAFIDQMRADRQYLEDKADIGTYFAVTMGMSDVGDAKDVMGHFDGSLGSIQMAVNAIEDHYADALSAGSGDFLMPLVGVLDAPFEV